MLVDLHIHTKYSFDSLLDPRKLVKSALNQRLSAIAVTDHNTLKGAMSTMHEAKSIGNLIVVPGIEIKTELGDVIGLYIQDDIKTINFQDVIDEIRNQGGLVVLPHPFRGHKGSLEKLASCADVIEGLNGRNSYYKNTEAIRLAKKLGKPLIASSDAHFSFEIGLMKTNFNSEINSGEELRELILKADRNLIGKESSFIVHFLTFCVGILKKKVRF